MYDAWGHTGVRYAKAIYFWRLPHSRRSQKLHLRRRISARYLLSSAPQASRRASRSSLARHTVIFSRCLVIPPPVVAPSISRRETGVSHATRLTNERSLERRFQRPTLDDSPGRSSILLYIPYVIFTMGSKEARNGRPVASQINQVPLSFPDVKTICFLPFALFDSGRYRILSRRS